MLSYRQRLPITHPNLGCYYKGPRSVKQLGQFDPASQTFVQAGATALTGIKNFFSGLFGKDPNKANYDEARELVWQEFKRLVDSPEAAAIVLGTATQTEALSTVSAAEEFRRQWQALADQYRGLIDAAWLEPRYREIHDFMTKVINDWRSRVSALSRFRVSNGVFGSLTQTASSYWPLLAGAALIFFMGRR